MIEAIYQLIKQIWEEGKNSWGVVSCSIMPNTQKGNKLDCESYRGIE
jgi:hypothetical protein